MSPIRRCRAASLVAALWLVPAAAAGLGDGAIHGIVLDTRDGTPVERVSVRLQSANRVVVTDTTGSFSFDDVPEGPQALYVSAVDFMLVKRTVVVAAGGTTEVTIALSEGTGTYTETVTVRGEQTERRDPGVAAEQTLGSRELQQLRGVLANDPLRAVQALPAVAATDDLRSEFAIRGAGISQMNFTFEGIATPFLLHTVQQVHDGGSVAMVNGDVLDEISVLNGSYPQRYGNRTGAEIEFRMREGSRDRTQSHVSVSAIDASGVTEGPIGDKRGSWLFSVRKSYLDLVVDRLYPDQNISFGFFDSQAKAVYDITPTEQVQLAFTGGRSRLDRDPASLGAGNLRNAVNQSALGIVTLRSTMSPKFVITQRAALTENSFDNTSRDGADLDSGSGRELIYRADAALAAGPRIALEAGSEIRRTDASGREQRLVGRLFVERADFEGASTWLSAYAQARLGGAGGWSLVPGVRVDRHTLTDSTTASPWIQAALPVAHVVTLRAGAGIFRQEPTIFEVVGQVPNNALRPERAYDVDLGVEGRIGATGRWQTTVYNREDRDLLRLAGSEYRLTANLLRVPSSSMRYLNALDGYARGVEWLVQRDAVNGFSGWASYALGFNRYRDHTTGEAFWGDYDQRHTINLYGNYRISDRFSLGARFRAGSNFPAAGYWVERAGRYFVASDRNTLRVPFYARADVRANRTFTWAERRLTLYVEGINILNRGNVRATLPTVNFQTFEATHLFDSMVPLVPSVGVLLEF